ncbi:MAG TPA: hypothetical protein VN493_14145 [Thermoanaerobaculia bacterium]|nr:hypothetical protein [Thermoanaerobaculia bacterium]
MKRLLLAFLALPLAAQSPEPGRAGAPLDIESFRYAREIVQVEPGLSALTLDASVLAHSDLDDLRIADAKGRQIPYLRERSSDPLIIELREPWLTEDDSDPRGPDRLSRYPLELPYGTLPACRLLADTTADVFERTVHVEGERNRRGKPKWRMPASVWRDPSPGTPAPPLEVELPSRPGETAYLIVDEGDNPPLPLSHPRLHLDTWTLRFFHPGGKLRLLYGRSDLGQPRYDLSLIASQLDPVARQVSLAPEPAAGENEPARVPRGLFWGALIAAVAVLLLVLARLVREEGARNA